MDVLDHARYTDHRRDHNKFIFLAYLHITMYLLLLYDSELAGALGWKTCEVVEGLDDIAYALAHWLGPPSVHPQ